MPVFCEEYDPDYHDQWDICGGLSLAQEGETAGDAYKRICLVAIKEKRFDESSLRALSWGIKKYPIFFEQWLEGL